MLGALNNLVGELLIDPCYMDTFLEYLSIASYFRVLK